MPASPARAVLLCAALASAVPASTGAGDAPQTPGSGRVRLAVAGLVHGHVRGFLRALNGRTDVELVGIAEPDAALRATVLAENKLPASVGFASLDEMLDRAQPEAIATFTSTFDHPLVVEAAARRHVARHDGEAAGGKRRRRRAIRRAAERSGIQVIVNYETTWYPSHGGDLADDEGQKRRPARSARWSRWTATRARRRSASGRSSSPWLTDPVKNGGGALFDFGCYGANLMTWLMDNAAAARGDRDPQHEQAGDLPARRRRGDDPPCEYPKAQGIMQASWNWPFGRKDFEVYGEQAYAIARVRRHLRGPPARTRGGTPCGRAPRCRRARCGVVSGRRGARRVKPSGLSSLENNLIVTEILAAARESAESGRTIKLAPRATAERLSGGLHKPLELGRLMNAAAWMQDARCRMSDAGCRMQACRMQNLAFICIRHSGIRHPA